MAYSKNGTRDLGDQLLSEALTKVLENNNFILRRFDLNTQDDAGEDFLCLVEAKENNREKNFVFDFSIQNKGISKIKIVKQLNHPYRGKIMYSIKLRNAKRYCYGVNFPLVITISDIENRNVYWYPIQLDDEITDRIEQQNKQNRDSIQVYIDPKNVLSNDTLQDFLRDISNSKEKQYYRDKTNKLSKLDIDGIRHVLMDEKNHACILDDLYDIVKRYDQLPTLPEFYLFKLYPFYSKVAGRSYYNNFVFNTDNNQLYDFFDSLKIEDGQLIVFKNSDLICSVDNYLEKIKKVIQFFCNNLIYFIASTDRVKHSHNIDVLSLYIVDLCECARCSYERFDYKSCLRQLGLSRSDESTISLFKKASVYSKIGKFRESYLLYKSILGKLKKEGKYIYYFVSMHNMSKLYRIIKHRYNIDTNISDVSIDEELIEVKMHVSSPVYEILVWIKDGRFLDDATLRIEREFQSILDNYFNDQYGGFSRNETVESLINYTGQLDLFLKNNYIFFDYYREFEQVIQKSVEGLFASYSIKNEESSRLPYFTNYSIGLMLRYFEPKKLNKLFNKYFIEKMNCDVSKSSSTTFIGWFETFIESLDSIRHFLGEEEQENYDLIQQTENMFGNFVIISSRLDLAKDETVRISNLLCSVLRSEKWKFRWGGEFISKFLHYKGKMLGVVEWENWLTWALENPTDYSTRDIILSFPNYISEYFPDYVISSNLFRLLMGAGDNEEHIGMLIEYLEILDKESRGELSETIEELLDKKFNAELYYHAAIYEVIDYEKHFEKYVQSVPTYEKISYSPFGNGKNRRLDNLLNLMFKNQLTISTEKSQSFYGGLPYYQWLFNLEGFDYSLFDPYWILNHPTKYYIDEFKKVPQIKEKLRKYILTNPTIKIVDIYVRHFSN